MLPCLNPVNTKDLSSSKVTTTPFLSKVHVSPRSHNWAIEIRLKLSASTNKTFEIDKSLEIAILPNLRLSLLSYHHRWHVHDRRGLPERWTCYHCRSCVESNRYQVPNVFHHLCSSPTHMRIIFEFLEPKRALGLAHVWQELWEPKVAWGGSSLLPLWSCQWIWPSPCPLPYSKENGYFDA